MLLVGAACHSSLRKLVRVCKLVDFIPFLVTQIENTC